MKASHELVEEERLEHEHFMRYALILAKQAGQLGEVPIGAVLVRNNQVIASAHNVRELAEMATGHAELLAIQTANRRLGAWRLMDCTLYVTLEPCPMCAGAIIMSRVDRIVYGAKDPKGGCGGSLMNLLTDDRFNHQPEVIHGILADEASDLLKAFFRQLRKRNKLRKKEVSN